MDSTRKFPTPSKGASLMLAFHMKSRLTIIIGTNTLAAQRVFAALEAGSEVVVLSEGGRIGACNEILWRADQREIELLSFDELAGPSKAKSALELFLDSRAPIGLVSITDTLMTTRSSDRRTLRSATQIYNACRARNIPVNVADIPELCDYSFTSSHRFLDPVTGFGTSLQIGVNTNGKGCRLSGRIKREVVAGLPKDVGVAVEKIGQLRNLAKCKDAGNNLHDETTSFSINEPVAGMKSESESEISRQRMNWVAQISEFWSLTHIANMTDEEMSNILRECSDAKQCLDTGASSHRSSQNFADSSHSLVVKTWPSQGRILLVGSGPGHPRLLTIAAYEALTKEADLVLSDKLVPEAVLALIPPAVEVRIARKFPGNADNAQSELMEAAIEAARLGKTVVRLKQGDPTVYGRGGEELLYFRQHGFEAIVIPGITSALAAPTFAGIPVTQRGVSESFVVCTGIGRQGKTVRLPGYQRSRTLVLLMGVSRLSQIMTVLQHSQPDDVDSGLRDGDAYPSHTPVALVERASIPDQRVIASTLQDIVEAVDSSGEQRPPGLLVIGWASLALWGQGDLTVLDDQTNGMRDLERIDAWLEGKRWRILEGLSSYWSQPQSSFT